MYTTAQPSPELFSLRAWLSRLLQNVILRFFLKLQTVSKQTWKWWVGFKQVHVKHFLNSAFNGRMLNTSVTPSYRDYICEFTQAYIKHYFNSFITDVNLNVYSRGQIWQHWSADRVSIRDVFCCIEFLQMCCLVCLNMMSSVKDMQAEVDFNKWGQSTAFHPFPPIYASQCATSAPLHIYQDCIFF